MLGVLLLLKSLSAWREKNGCVIICYCYGIGSKHTQILAILCTIGKEKNVQSTFKMEKVWANSSAHELAKKVFDYVSEIL